MKRIRITILVLGALLVTAKWGIDQSVSSASELLEGTWQIVSVQREGQNDPIHVGSRLHFIGNEVKLESWFAQSTDRPNDLFIAPITAIPWTIPATGSRSPLAQYFTIDITEQQKQMDLAAVS